MGSVVAARLAVAAFLLMLDPPSGSAQGTLPLGLSRASSFAAGSDSIGGPRERSEVAAALLSTGGLLVPAITGALMASHSGGSNQSEIGLSAAGVGLLLGPSAGYFYGGCPKRALAGIEIRAGISALTLAAMALTPAASDGPDIDIVVGGAGLVLVTLEGLYECFAVGDCVHRHDPARRPVGVWVAPGPAPRSINVAMRVVY